MSLEAAYPGLLADDLLRSRGHQAFDPDTLHRLVLLSTGDKEFADDMAAKREQQTFDEKKG